MSITVGHLQIVYSGGAANESQANSIGGAISTAAGKRVKSQDAGTPTPEMYGVTILDAMGNPEGTGTLRWEPSTELLSWKRYGGVTFSGMVVSSDGVYTIGDSSGYLVVQCTRASMAAVFSESAVPITASANKTFDNISPTESLLGMTDYRCFYLLNTHGTGTAYDVRLWVKSQPVGDDTLAIALDPAGLNGTAITLADETDSTAQLAAVTFSAPSTQATGLQLGDIGPGAYRPFWIKRSVPAETFTQVLANKSSLGFSALI